MSGYQGEKFLKKKYNLDKSEPINQAVKRYKLKTGSKKI